MKTWITKLTMGACALTALAFTSCKKDEVQATLVPTTPPTLTSTTSAVVLTQANSAQPALTYNWAPISFTWTGVDHPYTLPVNYSLQIDKKGNNFAAPVSIDAGAGPNTTLTVGALNTSLNTLGLTSGTATPLEVRLFANYVANAPLYSAAIPLTATSYTFVCLPPAGSSAWSIIGPAGVDWSTDIALKYNCDTNTFDLTRSLNAGDFKFRANNDWGLNYGSTTSVGGPLVANGGNITVAKAGTYTVKLDLNSMTYSIK